MFRWRRGQFLDMPKYRKMPDHWKDHMQREEECMVRPTPTGNAVCRCPDPETADWIAERLCLADKLEKMMHEIAPALEATGVNVSLAREVRNAIKERPGAPRA